MNQEIVHSDRRSDDTPPTTCEVDVVAIAASAGSLMSLRSTLAALPQDFPRP